jgi:hypothetical protein
LKTIWVIFIISIKYQYVVVMQGKTKRGTHELVS